MLSAEAGPRTNHPNLAHRTQAREGARKSYHKDAQMAHELQADVPFMREVLPIKKLVEAKRDQGLSVHLVIPTLNEGTNPATGLSSVGKTIDRLHGLRRVGLIDTVTVFDSDSTDDTEHVVRGRGVDFQRTSDILRNHEMEGIRGKGANLWAATLQHPGDRDILVFADADFNARPSQIQAIASPLIEDPRVSLSLSVFERRTHQGDEAAPSVQGGRVTRLTFKPLVGAFFPEVSGIIEPIAGLYAGRGSSLAESYFPTDYRVETALVIDALMRGGPNALAQVFCGIKDQVGQTTANLEKMATQITHEALAKAAEWGRITLPDGFLPNERTVVQHPIARNGHAVIGEKVHTLPFINLPAPASLSRA